MMSLIGSGGTRHQAQLLMGEGWVHDPMRRVFERFYAAYRPLRRMRVTRSCTPPFRHEYVWPSVLATRILAGIMALSDGRSSNEIWGLPSSVRGERTQSIMS